MHNAVTGFYDCSCATCRAERAVPLRELSEEDNLPEIYELLIKNVFSGELVTGDINIPTARAVAEKLMDGVIEGFGKDFDAIDYDSPDLEMLSSIEKNVFEFSAAKDYHQLRALTSALKDGNRIRTFAEFRREAINTLNSFVGSWLRTEYDSAIAGAQMAANWVRFEQNKGSMPLLQYSTVGDQRVREAHRELDGVVKHINDAFWNSYYPPNGWNCRCDVMQLTSGTVTQDADISYPEVPKMFRTNLAKQGQVFPAGHPYFTNLPDDIKGAAFSMLPLEHQYETIYEKNGGTVRRHGLVDVKEKDYKLHLSIAQQKAKKGAKVDILPIIHEKDKADRAKVLPGAKTNKNPDLRVNNQYVEVKHPIRPLKKAKIEHTISQAAKQADHCIIQLDNKVRKSQLYKISRGRFNNHSHLEIIEFRDKGGNYTVFTRNQLKKK